MSIKNQLLLLTVSEPLSMLRKISPMVIPTDDRTTIGIASNKSFWYMLKLKTYYVNEMRLQCEHKVDVMGRTIGATIPLIFLRLVTKEKANLLRQAEELLPLAPDLIGWRIEAFDQEGFLVRHHFRHRKNIIITRANSDCRTQESHGYNLLIISKFMDSPN